MGQTLKSQMQIDCEAGYTLKQAIRRSVARDLITQNDIRSVQAKGWGLSRKMKKAIAESHKTL